MTDVKWFFFFQAEDGIRDLTVTGVQTCALPISAQMADRISAHRWFDKDQPHAEAADSPDRGPPRSEEHTSELQSQSNLVCRLLLEKKKKKKNSYDDHNHYHTHSIYHTCTTRHYV